MYSVAILANSMMVRAAQASEVNCLQFYFIFFIPFFSFCEWRRWGTTAKYKKTYKSKLERWRYVFHNWTLHHAWCMQAATARCCWWLTFDSSVKLKIKSLVQLENYIVAIEANWKWRRRKNDSVSDKFSCFTIEWLKSIHSLVVCLQSDRYQQCLHIRE